MLSFISLFMNEHNFIPNLIPDGNSSIKTILGIGIAEGNGTPLQYSCLENPIDGGAWWAVVHGVAKSWT